MTRQKKEIIHTPKGTHDILPDLVPYFDKVAKEARRVAEFYGFQTIRTPHIEHSELFSRPLGESSDVVEKQMYAFRTRGGDALVLRPEGTAPIVRAYLEHGMQSWPQPVKLFYEGSFFRYENPQAVRKREFWQAGVEILGEADAVNDALIVRVLVAALEALHIKNISVHINSIGDKVCRPVHKKELLSYYRRRQDSLCKDCKNRLRDNPLRLLDCKNPSCQVLKKEAPEMLDHLCDACKRHFQEVLEFLDDGSISYFLSPHLVRGFDYYTRTVFEIFVNPSVSGETKTSVSDKTEALAVTAEAPAVTAEPREEKEKFLDASTEAVMSAVAIAGGGRYDDLADILASKQVPAVGGTLGIDRIVNEMRRLDLKVRSDIKPKVFLIQLGALARRKLFVFSEEFRKSGIPFSHSLSRESFKSQLKIASRLDIPYVLIVGQKEALDETAILRDTYTGSQETIPFRKLISTMKMRLK